MNRTPATLIATACLSILAACGDEGPPAGGDCRPGTPTDCTCSDGRSGTGTCGEAACDCAPRYALVAEPGSVDFGEVGRGASREAVLLLRNPAPRAVTIRSAVLSGADEYALVEALPASIAARSTATLVIRLSPAQAGTPVARLRVEAADADVAPVEVTLTARVPGPLLACSPGSVAFPGGWVGDVATAVVTCSNVGMAGSTDDGRLRRLELAVTGPLFSAAWREAPPVDGLAPGAAAVIDVQFAPTAAGEQHGTIAVSSDGGFAEVPLSGWAAEPPACDLQIPEALRLGMVEPGLDGQVELVLRNRRSDATCSIRDLRLCEGTDPAFALAEGTPSDATIAGGGELRVGLRFSPDFDSCPADVAAGCVEFELAPSPDGHRTIPISCERDARTAVLVAPEVVDFGSLYTGCDTPVRELTFINTSRLPITLANVAFSEGTTDEFSLRYGPFSHTTIAPGSSVILGLAYRPIDEGLDTGELLVTVDELDETFRATLVGRGLGRRVQEDSWQQHSRPMLDLLVVIDNGTTMGPEAARLVPELGGLPERILQQGVDARFAVTTTGLIAGGPGCPGGASGGEDGRFFPVDGTHPRILDEHTPNLRAAWEANLDVGICHTAPAQPLEAALRAVSPPLSTSADDPRHLEPNDGNLGFLRPDAYLWVLTITDRADVSPGTVSSYLTALQALKGPRTHLFWFFAITGDPGSGCTAADGRSAVGGDRLIDLAAGTFEGTILSICGAGWEPHLIPATAAWGPRTCFGLMDHPADANGDGVVSDVGGEFRVYVNEVEVPSSLDGEPVWYHDDSNNTLCFAPGHVPEGGALITARYEVACWPR